MNCADDFLAQIAFKGKTVFGFKKWEGPLVAVSGFQIAISGAPGHVIDCDGGRWWDGQGNAGGMLKPRAFDVQSLNSSTIKNLNVVNTPVQFMNISGSDGLRISNVTMDNSAGDSLDASLRVKRGRNTDGFDIRTSNNVFISDASVTNQDSCFLVTSGTNINLVRGRCTSGRGVSIGTGSLSTSDDNIIKSVTVRDTEITGSEIGLSILAATGATGSISGVMFSDITMTNITKYGILIEQDWDVKNGNGTGNATTGVPITDLTLSQVNGTVVLDATDVYVFCGDGSCSSWTWDRVHVTGGIRSDKCSHLPPGVSC